MKIQELLRTQKPKDKQAAQKCLMRKKMYEKTMDEMVSLRHD